MTDARDSCFGCGGHLRRNVYSGTLCPECLERHERGEISIYGDQLTERTPEEAEQIVDVERLGPGRIAA